MATKEKIEKEDVVNETPEAEASETQPKSEEELLKEQLDELKDQRLRLAAEYDNYRKRTQRERETLYGDASANTIAAFLSVYDDLERAIAIPTEDKSYSKGIEMIFSKLCETMTKLNVEEINPLNEAFDPNLHNAVMHVDDDSVGENTVVEVFQKGFKIGSRVIRHAMVKVAN